MAWNPNDPSGRSDDDRPRRGPDGRPYRIRTNPPQQSRYDHPYFNNVEELYAPIPERKRSPWALLIIVLLATMFIWEAFRNPTFPDARFHLQVEDTVAYAYGGTDKDSFNDVRRQLDENPQIETIVLKHIPGTTHLGENSRIAQLIRARGIDTHLESGSFIASGGVDLFLAGDERTMECGARIGVHSWRDENGATPASLGHDPIEPRMIAFHDSLGIGPEFYPFTRDSAPHESLYFLTMDDVERFDLLSDESCEPRNWLRWLDGF